MERRSPRLPPMGRKLLQFAQQNPLCRATLCARPSRPYPHLATHNINLPDVDIWHYLCYKYDVTVRYAAVFQHLRAPERPKNEAGARWLESTWHQWACFFSWAAGPARDALLLDPGPAVTSCVWPRPVQTGKPGSGMQPLAGTYSRWQAIPIRSTRLSSALMDRSWQPSRRTPITRSEYGTC